jgi:hypothetical protein
MVKQANGDIVLALKKSIDTLVLIELVKTGATYEQIRKVVGSVDNNTIAAVKTAVGKNKGEVQNG